MRLNQRIGHVVLRMMVMSAMGLLLWACGSGGGGGGGGQPPQNPLTASFVPVTTNPGDNSVSMQQNIAESTVDTVALDVVANDVTRGKVFGVVFDLGFDPNHTNQVEFVRYTKGQFLETTSNQVAYLVEPQQNDPRVLVVGISQLAPDPGADGSGVSGVIVTLYFKALNLGDAVLTFKNLNLIDPSDQAINVTPYAGKIEVK